MKTILRFIAGYDIASHKKKTGGYPWERGKA